MQKHCIIQLFKGIKSCKHPLNKIPLAMRLFLILLICSYSLANASDVFAQKTSISLDLDNCTVEEALHAIELESGYGFFINNKNINLKRRVSVSASSPKNINHILDEMFENTNVSYKIIDNKIVLTANDAQATQQQKTSVITGTVKDANGDPLIGVNVRVKGGTTGAITDLDGNFKLEAAQGAVLEVSYVGYATQEIKVSGYAPIIVTLNEDSEVLSEVVVTALGIKKESKSLTYNVQQLNEDELAKTKDMNIMSGLAGKVAGVSINASASGIGGGTRVVMRGAKSISGNNNALYVVDGVPMPELSSTQPTSQYQGAGQSGDAMSSINAEDIESISVLSGSAAAALYGSSAANGVVLITTKKGKEGKTSVSYSNSSTFYSPFVMPEFQNRYGSDEGSWFSWSPLMDQPSGYTPEDALQTGYNVANTVSLTTGTSKNQTYISLSAVNARGLVPNNELDRYNVSARNSTSFLDDKMTLDFGLMYSNVNEQNMLSQGEYANPLVPLYLFPRGDDLAKYQYYERFDVDRNIPIQYWPLSDNGLSMQNPYWIMNRNLYENEKNRFMANASLKYEIFDWLNVSGRVKIDRDATTRERKMYASTLNVLAQNSDKGSYWETEESTQQIYADAMLNVNKYFNEDKWNITAALGISTLDLQHKMLRLGGGLLTIPNLFTVNNINTANNLTYMNDNYHDRTNSIFGTFSLGYKGMAYLDASFRNDWLSALAGTNHKSILYPSIGASAIITNMVDIDPSILSYAKVRFSYSEVGNAPARFRAITTYSVSGGLNTISYFPAVGLEPERTHSWEAGLNLALFNNKLTLDATLYRSYTENQLFSPEISTTTGYSRMYVNAGKVTNRGVELSVGYKQKLGPVDWNTTLLWSLNQNKIDQLLPEYTNDELGVTVKLDEMDVYNLGGAKQRLTVGGSMGDLYVNKMRTDANGNIFVDSMTGALATDKNNYVYVGNVNPKYTLSWRNNFSWKGLNLGFMINARVGGVGVSATQAVMDYYGVSERTAAARDNGGVLVNNTLMDAQKWFQTVGGNGLDYVGSEYVYSMTNVRLGELTLGYDFPVTKWCGWLKGLNLTFIGRNLFMFYCKAPFDPESTAGTGTFNQGMDYFMQPSLRSLGFSAKVTF